MKNNKSKRKSAGISLMPYFIGISIFVFLFSIYIGYRATISDRKLFTISFIAIFGGILFESFRKSKDWKLIIVNLIGACFFSLFSFLPGKNEHVYNFENHIKYWQYFFIIFYSLIFVIFNKEKVTAKITEGVTLMLSLSLIYWVIDYGFLNIDNWFILSLIFISLVFSLYSIFNALTYFTLSRTARIILSLWSSIIIFVFGIDNIVSVFNNEDIENTKYLSEGLYIGIQYFFLGISAIYMMNNYLLIAGFLPSKNGNYKKDLNENKKEHIKRFSEEQVLIKDSVLCIIYSFTIYYFNYKYQVLPRHTMIWFVIISFPLIIKLIDIINHKKTTANNG